MARRKSYQKVSPKWHNSHWTIRYWELNHQTGEWKQRRAKLDGCDDKNNKKAAREAADAFMARINEQNNKPQASSAFTFAEFVSGHWLTIINTRKKPLKPSTMYGYESLLNQHLLPEFGSKRLDSISPSDMTKFFADRYGKYAPRTLRNLYHLAKSIFNTAADLDLIEKSPLRPTLHKPSCERTHKPRLKAEEIRRVFECLTEPWQKVLLLVVAITSRRVGEVLALQWEDFDEVNAKLWVRHSLWRGQRLTPKTQASIKKIHLPSVLVVALKEHKMNSTFTAPDDFIFCRADGTPCDPDYLRRFVLYPALDAAGIEKGHRTHGFHLFRHSGGRMLYEATRDLKAVQEYLAHSQISTTADTYVEMPDEIAGEATELVARELNCDLFVTQTSERVH